MNEIENLLNNSRAYRHVDANGDDYVIYGGGTSPTKAKPTYPRSITSQGTLNEENAAKAKKFDDMQQAEFIKNVEESSLERGRFEGASELKNRMEALLYDKQVQDMKRDVGPNDINDLRMGDAAADAQGAPRSDTPWSKAVREVAGDMDRNLTVEENTDIRNSSEGWLGSPNIRTDVEDVLANEDNY